MAQLCPECVGYCGLVKMSDEQLTPAKGTKAATIQAGATDSSRHLSQQRSNADGALDLLHSSQAAPQLVSVDPPRGMSYAHNSAANEPRPVTAALVTVNDRLDQLELKLRSLRCAGQPAHRWSVSSAFCGLRGCKSQGLAPPIRVRLAADQKSLCLPYQTSSHHRTQWSYVPRSGPRFRDRHLLRCSSRVATDELRTSTPPWHLADCGRTRVPQPRLPWHSCSCPLPHLSGLC